MKKISKMILSSLIVFTVIMVSHCSKKKDDTTATTCKTCKAYNANGSVAAERKTCNAADEQGFRAENPGKEISCN